jgi:hypothetical protein
VVTARAGGLEPIESARVTIGKGGTFVRFTPAGTLDGAAIPLGFIAESITWTGREYALGGTQGSNAVFARVGGCGP